MEYELIKSRQEEIKKSMVVPCAVSYHYLKTHGASKDNLNNLVREKRVKYYRGINDIYFYIDEEHKQKTGD